MQKPPDVLFENNDVPGTMRPVLCTLIDVQTRQGLAEIRIWSGKKSDTYMEDLLQVAAQHLGLKTDFPPCNQALRSKSTPTA